MTPQTSQSETFTTKRTISVKPAHDLATYKEIVYLTRDYYRAIKDDKPLPKTPLPDLNVLIDAALVVDAYIKAQETLPSLRLYNATLDHKTIAAVWFFANEPTVNVKLGKHQMFVIKHS